jgi:hypothetical protein
MANRSYPSFPLFTGVKVRILVRGLKSEGADLKSAVGIEGE